VELLDKEYEVENVTIR